MKITKNTPLKQVLAVGHPCKCHKCEHGCTMGSGFLVEEDIPRLAKYLQMSEEELKERLLEKEEKFNTTLWRPKILKEKGKPYGQCIFFNEKHGCSIHEVKPLQCKVSMGCSPYAEELDVWFTLNHFLNPYDPESVRQYASYLEAGGKTLPEAELQVVVPDKILLRKILNFEIVK
ncbi:YkgJ family cysteine cluster protein [Candidatus Woesearchaeota archaeon]|nr:YkgJ family cysteine cluster protein [Candidatus Woesearchaeota archaeon]